MPDPSSPEALAPEYDDRYAGLPAEWSLSARETYASVSETTTLDSAGLAALYEACALLAIADAATDAVTREGLTTTGSQGQPVAHPLLAEARLCRTAAMATLRALGGSSASSASAAGAALVAKRWERRGNSSRRTSR